MNVGEALAWARARVDTIDARLLLQEATGLGHAQLVARPEALLDAAQQQCYRQLVEQRTTGEPVAYLLGWREFFGRRFRVTRDVLIPRPETELLVEAALERLRGRSAPRVLDLGCGSGILAITLALELAQAEVTACDISPVALAVAEDNARALGACVAFRRSDWYAALGNESFDLIVSNPPYVAAADPHLQQGDLRFEPRGALSDGSGDGLSSLHAIIAGAPHRLCAGGWLLVEHGYDQGAEVAKRMQSRGLCEVATLRDLAGQDRVTLGCVDKP